MTTSTRQVGGVTIVDIKGRIVLGEENHFTEAWTICVNGKDSGREFHYTRKK